MDRILVVVFDNESKAYDGFRILQELDVEDSITIFASAVVTKDASGKMSVKQETDEGPAGTAVGLLTGSLLGALGGPVGVAVGVGVGTVGGLLYDAAQIGVGEDFLDEVGKQMKPGKAAVVAEVWEEWVLPVDTRIEAAGGTVFRRTREEVVAAHIERDVAALKGEVASLNAELARAAKEQKAKLETKIDTAKGKLRAMQDRAKSALTAAKEQGEAKVKALQARAEKARGDAKANLDRRVVEARADYKRRSDELDQAWQLAKKALAP